MYHVRCGCMPTQQQTTRLPANQLIVTVVFYIAKMDDRSTTMGEMMNVDLHLNVNDVEGILGSI